MQDVRRLLLVVGSITSKEYKPALTRLRRNRVAPTVFRMTEPEWMMDGVTDAVIDLYTACTASGKVKAAMAHCLMPLAPGSELLFPVGEVMRDEEDIESLAAKLIVKRYLETSGSHVVGVVLSETPWERADTRLWLKLFKPDVAIYVLRPNGKLEIC